MSSKINNILSFFKVPRVKRSLAVLMILLIIFSSLWYFLGGRCLIGWDDWRSSYDTEIQPILIILDGKEIAVSDSDDIGGFFAYTWKYNTVELVLLPGSHVLKLSFENGTVIEKHDFFMDFNLHVSFMINSDYNITFKEGHFNPNEVGGHFIGLTNSQLILYVASVVVLCLLTFKYWKRSVQKEEQKNLELENEKGNSNEPNSKNKGG